jgi:hypothetical protein
VVLAVFFVSVDHLNEDTPGPLNPSLSDAGSLKKVTNKSWNRIKKRERCVMGEEEAVPVNSGAAYSTGVHAGYALSEKRGDRPAGSHNSRRLKLE